MKKKNKAKKPVFSNTRNADHISSRILFMKREDRANHEAMTGLQEVPGIDGHPTLPSSPMLNTVFSS